MILALQSLQNGDSACQQSQARAVVSQQVTNTATQKCLRPSLFISAYTLSLYSLGCGASSDLSDIRIR